MSNVFFIAGYYTGRPLKSTNHLLSWQILISQSFLKPFETIGEKLSGGEGRNSFLLTSNRRVRTDGRSGVHYVMTKLSLMDSLPNFLTRGVPLRALRARESSDVKIYLAIKQLKRMLEKLWKPFFFYLLWIEKTYIISKRPVARFQDLNTFYNRKLKWLKIWG